MAFNTLRMLYDLKHNGKTSITFKTIVTPTDDSESIVINTRHNLSINRNSTHVRLGSLI